MVPRYEPDKVVQALAAHKITVFAGGPAPIYMGLLTSPFFAGADLKALQVDQVKLAREFVAAIDGPAQEQAFALSLINLAEVRGVEVVAKGVESREQAWRLAEIGCRYGQGFFFSKPLGASGLLAVLRQGTLRG